MGRITKHQSLLEQSWIEETKVNNEINRLRYEVCRTCGSINAEYTHEDIFSRMNNRFFGIGVTLDEDGFIEET